MNHPSSSSTFKPATMSSRRILSDNGLDCSIVSIAPGEEITCLDRPMLHDHLLFVIEGNVSVAMEDVTCLLKRNEALRLPAEREHQISASGGWAQVLRVDLPAREAPVEPLYTFAPS